MYCNYCGKTIQDDANICAYCGIAGVCLGVAEYFDVDVTIVRLVWLIASVVTGVGLLSYPIAWIVMPEEPHMLSAQASAGQQVTNQ